MKKKEKYIFFGVILFNLIFNIFLPLHPDEAYYWVWSNRLQLSYFDHPPMVAYFIKIFTLIWENEFFVRLGAVFSLSIASYINYILAKKIFNKKVGKWSLYLFLFLPLTQAGFLLMTPDSPLILFWSLTSYFAYGYIFEEKKLYAYFTGICAGFMLMSKYTGITLIMAIFLFLIVTKYRKVFLKKEIYIAMLFCVISFMPVLIWNYKNDWISFVFQYSHGVAEKKVINLKYLGQFLSAQLGVFNPILFICLFYYMIKNFFSIVFDNKKLYLAIIFLFPFVFFMYQGMFKKSEANWAAPSYFTGTILLAYYLFINKRKNILRIATVIGIVLICMLRFPEAFPFLPKKAVLKTKFLAYKELYQEANYFIKEGDTVIGDSYQGASLASYYIKGRPKTYILNKARYSNYDMWIKNEKPNLDNVIYVGKEKKIEELKSIFKNVELLKKSRYKDRYVKREIVIVRCSGKI